MRGGYGGAAGGGGYQGAGGYGGPPGGMGGGMGGGAGGYNNGQGDGYQANNGSGAGANSGNFAMDNQTTQVTIPKEFGGAIIGRGGERIRNIRQQSGADVKMAEPAEGSTDRLITLTGNSQQIQHAQYLMQQCVREHGDPQQQRNGAGGGAPQ